MNIDRNKTFIAMAKEKIEDVSTEVLIRRKRFIRVLLGIFIGVTAVWVGLIIYDLITDGQIQQTTIYGVLPSLCCIWIPIMMLGKVNAELRKRDDK